MIVITVDVGGSKTAVAITRDGERIAVGTGPGAPVRPGRAVATGSAVADQIRATMAQAKLLAADAIVVGAAGAGRSADAEEIRGVLLREKIAPRVVVTTDVALAFAALGVEVGVLLVAGTGSIAVGRAPDGREVRQGGHGWQMGDEGSGYWIGRAALAAAGAAHDGRGPATSLLARLGEATGAPSFRDLVAWSTSASPREVAQLTKSVAAAAASGDHVAKGILAQAAQHLAGLVNALAGEFPREEQVPVGFAGGLVSTPGLLGPAVAAAISAPFLPAARPVDPLGGGPRLANA